MSKELPIILASHGEFAQGALNCAEMLMGKQNNIEIISVQVDSNIDALRETFSKYHKKLDQGSGVIILVDIVGGTPCNLAAELLMTHQNIALFCGFNIPVLLEILSNRELSLNEIKQLINEVYPQSFIDFSQLTNQTESDTADL